MRASTHRQRVAALGRAGYHHYDESTATCRGRLSEQLLADYDGAGCAQRGTRSPRP